MLNEIFPFLEDAYENMVIITFKVNDIKKDVQFIILPCDDELDGDVKWFCLNSLRAYVGVGVDLDSQLNSLANIAFGTESNYDWEVIPKEYYVLNVVPNVNSLNRYSYTTDVKNLKFKFEESRFKTYVKNQVENYQETVSKGIKNKILGFMGF